MTICRQMVITAVLVFLVGLCAPFAVAQTGCGGFLSQLNAPNAALAPYLPSTGTFGTVCVNLVDNNTATITFTAASGFLIGGNNAMAANINAPLGTFAVSAAATSFPTHLAPALTVDAPPYNPSGPPNVDDEGRMNVVIDNFDGFTHAFRTGTITIDLTSGTFAGPGSVLAFNADGRDAAAHIFVCGDPECTKTGGSPATGWAGETAVVQTPEPATIALLGSLLLFSANRLKKRLS